MNYSIWRRREWKGAHIAHAIGGKPLLVLFSPIPRTDALEFVAKLSLIGMY
jgi:hypothetical protein